MVQLNQMQQQAVHHIDGPLLVIAGAGSGKTSVIIEKLAYLMRCGYEPHRLYAITFTNKAAEEMRERLAARVGVKPAKRVVVCTFHTLGLTILKAESHAIDRRSHFTIIDASDVMALLRQILTEHSIQYTDKLERFQAQISRWKNQSLQPEAALTEAANTQSTAIARAYIHYEAYLKAHNCVDFDDLICLPVRLFTHEPQIRERWQGKINYLLVDEYQDTNQVQYAMLAHLTALRQQFTVVGDDDQSIYAWRGAQPDNLRTLQSDYPTLQVIKLEQNYRSSRRILRVANTLIAHNDHLFEKQLWSQHDLGAKLRCITAKDEQDEAQHVIDDITRREIRHRGHYGQYAILYRSNHQARPIEQALREAQIPYQLHGDTAFFSRMEIKDVMAYCRLFANPDDDAAFLRIINVPRRAIGPQTLTQLQDYCHRRRISLFQGCGELGLMQVVNAQALEKLHRFHAFAQQTAKNLHQDVETLPETLKQCLVDIDYEQWLYQHFTHKKSVMRRMGYIDELIQWMHAVYRRNEQQSFTQIIQHIALMDMLDRQKDDVDNDAVQLMTLHASKGLEFENVYIIGMEENILPHHSSAEPTQPTTSDGTSLEEERRLAYVGITRAKQRVTFSYATARKRYGESISCEMSRFLAELPQDDLLYDATEQEVHLTEEEKEAHANEHLNKCHDLLKQFTSENL